MQKVKAVIADDSVVYRTQIRAALTAIPGVEVIGAVSNGKLAIDFLKSTKADLLILDLEMPDMNGLETLIKLREEGIKSTVLVFSSASKRGAEITLEALRRGARDFVTKPGPSEGSPQEKIRELLEPKISALFSVSFAQAAASVQPSTQAANVTHSLTNAVFPPATPWEIFRPKAIVIGSSTGGPNALEAIFSGYREAPAVPIFITQHMPPIFTAAFAERLASVSGLRVKEAEHGEEVRSDRVYVAKGDYHMRIRGNQQRQIIELDQGPRIQSVRPAVDPMFSSASEIWRASLLGIVLTGMGADGAEGSRIIKNASGTVLIQSAESCVVYGMPAAVERAKAYDQILNLEQISAALREKTIPEAFLRGKAI